MNILKNNKVKKNVKKQQNFQYLYVLELKKKE